MVNLSNAYPITHITVRDILPQNETIVIGHMYPVVPEAPVNTAGPLLTSDEDDDEDSREAKVVKRGRRPGAKTSEVAETK